MIAIETTPEKSRESDTDNEYWQVGPEDDDIVDWRVKYDLPSVKGGAGSGNWGHRGRTGSEGGSVGGGGGTSPHYRGDVVTFDKTPSAGGTINGIPIKHQSPADFGSIADHIDEPPQPKLLGKKLSAGVVVQESDGRIWVVEPSGHYGGYEHTFAKGRVEDGLTMQQTARKEAYEEMGLNVELTGYLRDGEGSTTVTRYYTARRIGGDPADAHWETDKVKLATPEKLKKMLNVSRDRETLSLLTGEKGGAGSGNFGHGGRQGHEGGSIGRGSGEYRSSTGSDDISEAFLKARGTLSDDQHTAVSNYVQESGYFNGPLRNPDFYATQFSYEYPYGKRVLKAREDLDSVLSQRRVPENVYLYRGIKDKSIMPGEGGSFQDLGYMSTTLSESRSRDFARPESIVSQKEPALLRIRARQGQSAAYLEGISTQYHGEHEVLLPRGSKIHIDRISTDGNGLTIYDATYE